jgi:acetylornithine deacetylase/succinyl-diaminopimelate desuccinylase-like protein
MVKAFGREPIRKRISGGSLPIAPFVDPLNKIPAVTVVTVNADKNQHGPNENLRLGIFKEGILTVLAIFTESGRVY